MLINLESQPGTTSRKGLLNPDLMGLDFPPSDRGEIRLFFLNFWKP